ncbi:6709_t:CDS:2, partial [Gigaspora margarita]
MQSTILDVATTFSFNDYDYDITNISSHSSAYEYNNSANISLSPYFSIYESNDSALSFYVNAHNISNTFAKSDFEVQPEDINHKNYDNEEGNEYKGDNEEGNEYEGDNKE